MGKILLFIGIAYFVILFLAMCCPAPVKKGEEWRCSLNGVLMKEGINEKEKDMYALGINVWEKNGIVDEMEYGDIINQEIVNLFGMKSLII